MKRFENRKLDKRDHLYIEIAARITRVIAFPIFLLVRIFLWVWDYDYLERFNH